MNRVKINYKLAALCNLAIGINKICSFFTRQYFQNIIYFKLFTNILL
jgi:hypothetical protein